MRQQIFIERGARGVWADARVAAKEDEVSLSRWVTTAIAEKLLRRARRAKSGTVVR